MPRLRYAGGIMTSAFPLPVFPVFLLLVLPLLAPRQALVLQYLLPESDGPDFVLI